jgi:RNA polymerase sigma-70 factor, ECF subfamily
VQRESILRLLRERIVAFAASRYGRDVAEDVAQEALAVLHEKYQQVTELEQLGPLALQIARFKMLSLRRKVVRRGEHTAVPIEESPLEDPRDDPEQQFERQEMLERLTAAMAKLGDRCKELIRYKLEGKTFPEIQRLMGANSINTIYTWDLRCRKNLLELMGGCWEREDKK